MTTPKTIGLQTAQAAISAAVMTGIAMSSHGDVLTFLSSGVSDAGYYGNSVTHLKDVDGDGYDDLLVGAPHDDIGSLNAPGKAYVYSGKTGGVIRTHLSPNIEADGWFGDCVLGLGDVNGDSRGDYAIAAPNEGANVTGNVYVYSGSSGSLLYTIVGTIYRTGGAMGLVPDCTGDGLPELVLGYAGPFGGNSSVKVYQAKNGSLWKTLTPPAGPTSMAFGFAVSGVPDVTGDGKGDILIGAHQWDDSQFTIYEGAVFVFNGASGALYDSIESPDQQSEGHFGWSVAGIPDVNGDGRGDILVGAPQEMPDGSSDLTGQVHLMSGLNGNFIRTFSSPNPEDGGDFGWDVKGVSDLTGDGKTDVVVGAPYETVALNKDGRVYILDVADGSVVLTRTPPGAEWEKFGASVSMERDVNGDGEPDLLVGSPYSDALSGAAFLWRTIDNDPCSLFAPPISISNGTYAYTTVGAGTTGPAEPECNAFGDDQVNSDVFYSYSATCDGILTVTTCESVDYDSRIAVYQGCGYSSGLGFPCSFGTIIGCNDDSAGCGTTSKLQVPVTAGTCYRIRIGGYESAQGSGTFTVSCSATCLGDLTLDGAVDAADLATLLGQWGGSGSADLNGDGVVNAADLALMLGAWGPC